MTDPSTETPPAFPDGFSLDLLVPDASDFNIETHLKGDTQLKPRNVVLFGM